ncbi:hypothetical protein O181_019265 [Austropuccinia psidii MF-1]|uniref:Uncharacterized protein n=1 Tax=Austropuccinia psidii MF-1 TaxID=1389203 RepID=A0A9Q3CBG4_9BASI|nr:hypothetical protein [Austropuccinia psidii MF-1]
MFEEHLKLLRQIGFTFRCGNQSEPPQNILQEFNAVALEHRLVMSLAGGRFHSRNHLYTLQMGAGLLCLGIAIAVRAEFLSGVKLCAASGPRRHNNLVNAFQLSHDSDG